LGDEARLIAAVRVIEATLPKMPTPVEIRAN